MIKKGPMNLKSMLDHLQSAKDDELDNLFQQYLNAFSIQKCVAQVVSLFDKIHEVPSELKNQLSDLGIAVADYLEDFNSKLLLASLERTLKALYIQQGYIVNVSNLSITCGKAYQQLLPLKDELSKNVSLENLIDSFVLINISNEPTPTKLKVAPSVACSPPKPPPLPQKISNKKLPPPVITTPKAEKEDNEANKEALFKKIADIGKALNERPHEMKQDEAEQTKRMSLALKRELASKALEASRRRNLKSFSDLREDPSLSVQSEVMSRGKLFLSMLHSQLSERKEKALKAKQKAASATCSQDDGTVKELQRLNV